MTDEKKLPRFYVPNLEPGELALPESESHHARSVRRLGPGEKVELFDGQGQVAAGSIVSVGRRETIVLAEEVISELQHLPRVHLALAVPKGKRLDWLLEKVTELGVASIWPVVFGRSVAEGGRIDRWDIHCLAAAKQCGLNWLPELHEPINLTEFLAGLTENFQTPSGRMLKIVGDLTDDSARLAEILADRREVIVDDVILVIGPEGGFTDDERAKLAEAEFQSVRLGQTILRIETAAVALLAAVKAFFAV